MYTMNHQSCILIWLYTQKARLYEYMLNTPVMGLKGISGQNNAKSPFFLKLPAEARNTIYKMVVGWVHMDFGGASDTIKDKAWTARACKIEPDAFEYCSYEKWKREG